MAKKKKKRNSSPIADPTTLFVVNTVADSYGIPRDDFIRFAMNESMPWMDPSLVGGKKTPTSAKGLFQFLPGPAWEYGIDGEEFDPYKNADAAARMYIENRDRFRKNGLPFGPTEAYLAHNQGAGGAMEIMRAARGQGELSAARRERMLNQGVGKGIGELSDQELAETFMAKQAEKVMSHNTSRHTVGPKEVVGPPEYVPQLDPNLVGPPQPSIRRFKNRHGNTIERRTMPPPIPMGPVFNEK